MRGGEDGRLQVRRNGGNIEETEVVTSWFGVRRANASECSVTAITTGILGERRKSHE